MNTLVMSVLVVISPSQISYTLSFEQPSNITRFIQPIAANMPAVYLEFGAKIGSQPETSSASHRLLIEMFFPLLSTNCLLCSTETVNTALCEDCGKRIITTGTHSHDTGTNSPFRYRDDIRTLITRAKTIGDHRSALTLCQLTIQALDSWIDEAAWDFIIPIPPQIFRTAQRGLHLPDLFAQAISRRLRSRALSRKERSILRWKNPFRQAKQSRSSSAERMSNLTDQFRLFRGTAPLLRQSHILLVDDVTTTGATLDAATAALKTARPTRIERVAIAHVR